MESPIPANGPINPARIPLIRSPSTSSPFALASSSPAVTPTTSDPPNCGSVLKKLEYVVSASFCSSLLSYNSSISGNIEHIYPNVCICSYVKHVKCP